MHGDSPVCMCDPSPVNTKRVYGLMLTSIFLVTLSDHDACSCAQGCKSSDSDRHDRATSLSQWCSSNTVPIIRIFDWSVIAHTRITTITIISTVWVEWVIVMGCAWHDRCTSRVTTVGMIHRVHTSQRALDFYVFARL